MKEKIQPAIDEVFNDLAQLFKSGPDVSADVLEKVKGLIPKDGRVKNNDGSEFVPGTESTPITVGIVRVAEKASEENEGKVEESLAIKVRGGNQIEFTRRMLRAEDDKGVIPESTFKYQRYNPSELTPEQRAGFAEQLQIAMENAEEGSGATKEQIAQEIAAFNNNENVDIWMPFGENHVLQYGETRAQEQLAWEVADMASFSAYKDKPIELAGEIQRHFEDNDVISMFDQEHKRQNPVPEVMTVPQFNSQVTEMLSKVDIIPGGKETVLKVMSETASRLAENGQIVTSGSKTEVKETPTNL